MKKICILLAFISLLSCCFVGCGKETQNTTPTQSSTTVQTPPIVEETKITLSDIEKRAVDNARSSIKMKLLNPSSYTENHVTSGTYKWIITNSSGEEEKRIYICVFIDYSAQNRMGGYEREDKAFYYYCSADALEMPVKTSLYKFDLVKIDTFEYAEAKENGKEF